MNRSVSLPTRKAFAYITHRNRLLVFTHPFAPEAGVQVPAGTIEDGERPEDAVMREAFEETGLTDLTLAHFLGERLHVWSNGEREVSSQRYFYHLRCNGDPPATWRHVETHTSDGSGPHVFEFCWALLPAGVPALIAEHDACLPQLIETMSSEAL